MARVVEYDTVRRAMAEQSLNNLYYNSGAFGYPPGVPTRTVGWVGPPDETIRPAARGLVRQVAEPWEANLARLAVRAWREALAGGTVWAMPRSHWAYELDFGSQDWLPDVLARVGVDSATLAPLTTGAAVEFEVEEGEGFGGFLEALLGNLSGSSDFQLAWPGRPAVCTVHHHKQLWWTTPDDAVYARLDALVPA